VPSTRTARAHGEGWQWGLFAPLSVVVAVGIFLMATANRGGQEGAWWADPLFFTALLVISLPIGMRLLSTGAHGTERVSLVVLLAAALYLCKVLRSPIRFGGFDEFLHLRTAQDIFAHGTIFDPNTLLPISPYYPGLELVTSALSGVGEIPIHGAAVILLAVARLVFLLSFFFFFAMATNSARVAGIASFIYMVNPQFLYFDSQFAYESLALPLAAFVLYLLARRAHSSVARWMGLTVILLITLPPVVITHHVTSFLLAVFLLLWATVGLVMRRRDRARPGTVAVLAVLLVAGWSVFVAPTVIDYLAPMIESAGDQVIQLLLGKLDPRQLFVAPSGGSAPAWERLIGSASVGVTLLLLPLGLLIVWIHHRWNPVTISLAIIALLYPVSLVARLTPVGADVATRMPEFLYIGVGAVVGLALARISYRGLLGGLRLAVVGSALAVLVVGGVLVGMPGWERLPGPYLVSADARSIESEGLAAAAWSKDVLGSNNRFVADRVNRLLLATYGRQTIVTSYAFGVAVNQLYFAPEVGDVEREIVQAGNVTYLLADRRLTTDLPTVGYYFDRGEERLVGKHVSPLDPALLDKFDHTPGVSRIFDSGNIRIYDISGIAAGR
jgi:hypothetical protein